MADTVEELRKNMAPSHADCLKAADEIERLRGVINSAVQIATDHAKFCKDEYLKGGSPDLLERSKGVQYIADKIAAPETE